MHIAYDEVSLYYYILTNTLPLRVVKIENTFAK